MPHYYFDINDVPDDQGKQLDNIEEAHVVARRLLADNLARTTVNTGYYKSWSCLVRDGDNGKASRIVLALLVEDMNDAGGGNIIFHPT